VTSGRLRLWAWLAIATYRGSRTHKNRTIESWGSKIGDVDVELGCLETDIARPIALFYNTTHRRTLLHFDHYQPRVTNTRVFNPLPNCA
jgi:hypothetical protein